MSATPSNPTAALGIPGPAMRWRRLMLWGMLAAALLAGLAYAFQPRPVAVDFTIAATGTLAVTIDEEGETRVRDVFVLSAPVMGRLHRIELDVGDTVVAGETVVAQIEPVDPDFLDRRGEREAEAAVAGARAAEALARAELDQAQAELDFARVEVERARELIRDDTIAQRQLDEAERAFKTRRAAVATAGARLSMRAFERERAEARLLSPVETRNQRGQCDCVPVTAPVGGRVLRIVRESEGVVRAGDALVEIGDPRNLEIVTDLLSSEAVRVEPGQIVAIEEWGGPAPLAGVVRRVEPYGFTKVSALGIEEQRVNVIIDFTDPNSRWRRLGHGYRVEVRIRLWRGDDVLKVPLTALFRDGDRWALFTEADGRAHLTPVTLGHRSDLDAEITAGLAAGARVVLNPNDRLGDGVRIGARE